VKFADPALIAATPNCVDPSKKAMDPVGVPAVAVTLVVNVTGLEANDGFIDDPTALKAGVAKFTERVTLAVEVV
jgi:hypothetical protein